MVDWMLQIGKRRIRIRNFEIFMIIALTTIYITAAVIKENTWLYNSIVSISKHWESLALESDKLLLMAFILSTFGNTSILIVFPYAFIVFEIGMIYPNWWLLGIVSGAGAAIGEITSYIVGRLIGSSKKISESELGEKFYRMHKKFEERPGRIPFTVFIFALTPLPDDMILVPMGMMKYPYWKSIFPCFLGKTGLTTFMAWLGYVIGHNEDFLNRLAATPGWGWAASILKILVPSDKIDPAGDLIQFSLVLIIIYIIVRWDFERISMRKLKERKMFEKMLFEGGNFTFEELCIKFNIHNTERFRIFLEQFAEKYDNVRYKDNLFHFDRLGDKKKAFIESMDLAEYIFERLEKYKGYNLDEEKTEKKD